MLRGRCSKVETVKIAKRLDIVLLSRKRERMDIFSVLTLNFDRQPSEKKFYLQNFHNHRIKMDLSLIKTNKIGLIFLSIKWISFKQYCKKI